MLVGHALQSLYVVNHRGQAGYIFTPLQVADEVGGLYKTLSCKNEWGDIQHLAFHEEKVKQWSLFRTEYNGYMTLHCQQAIKEAIEGAQLTGLCITTDLGNIFLNDQPSH